MRFWRSKGTRRPPPPPESRWPEFLELFRSAQSDLMLIAGPEDGGSVCSDWIGAVVSVSGQSDCFPALVDAIEDGVFHVGCRHKLIPFRQEDGEAEAMFCTKLALSAMVRRRRHGRAEPAEGAPPDIEAVRQEFARLYDEARASERDGRLAEALGRCQAALRLLTHCDLFGENQPDVVRILKGRMQTVLRGDAGSTDPPAATG